MANRAYEIALKNVKNPLVKLSGGLPGSGKSDFSVSDLSADFNGIIFDTLLADYPSTVDKLEKATRANKEIEIHLLIQDPEISWYFTKKRTRPVDLNYFVDKVIEFPKTIKKLLNDYPDYRWRFKDIRGVFNRDEALKLEFVDDTKALLDIANNFYYNKDELKNFLKDIKYDENSKQTIQARLSQDRRTGRERPSEDQRILEEAPREVPGIPEKDRAVEGLKNEIYCNGLRPRRFR